MIFNSQIEIDASDIENLKSDICFHSRSLDDRGDLTNEELRKANVGEFFEISLDAASMRFELNGFLVNVKDINSYLDRSIDNAKINRVVLDATTLGVAEILYILRWVNRLKTSVDVSIIYVEPETYPPRLEIKSEFGLHQFKLSKYSVGYRSLPGFTKVVTSSTKTHLIALLGFERVRLGQLITNDEGAFIGSITPIFGVPGFKPYYDKHTIFQNIESLKNRAEKPKFSSANNPYDTFKLLEFIHQGVKDRVVNIAPIGTKPMAIGACLFVLKNLNNNVGVMYDHPTKSKNRTEGFSKIHLYSITF